MSFRAAEENQDKENLAASAIQRVQRGAVIRFDVSKKR
jgi:hypothetical protein